MIARKLLTATFALCLSTGVADASERIPANRPAVSEAIEFPDVGRATRKEGAFVPARNVVMVIPGLTKDQVYALLGVPHFHEGLFGVRRWNYILNFYTGAGDKFVACQYQIRFDRKARVAGAWFREQACADILGQDLAVAKPATATG